MNLFARNKYNLPYSRFIVVNWSWSWNGKRDRLYLWYKKQFVDLEAFCMNKIREQHKSNKFKIGNLFLPVERNSQSLWTFLHSTNLFITKRNTIRINRVINNWIHSFVKGWKIFNNILTGCKINTTFCHSFMYK